MRRVLWRRQRERGDAAVAGEDAVMRALVGHALEAGRGACTVGAGWAWYAGREEGAGASAGHRCLSAVVVTCDETRRDEVRGDGAAFSHRSALEVVGPACVTPIALPIRASGHER